MDVPDKLYTVEDIAIMTSLTTRTIRNYLKTGLLKGRKIGGQWRFTQKDIEGLMESGEYATAVSQQTRRDVTDFLDGVNTDLSGEIQVCAIVDVYVPAEAARERTDRLCQFLGRQQDNARMNYEYVEAEQKARYTLFGSAEFLSGALAVIAQPAEAQ